MAWPPILVRYGEIGIKSRSVRIQFERRLVECIEEQLLRRNVEAQVEREQGRILVRASDTEKAIDALRHTFGVVSASPATEGPSSLDAIAQRVLDAARSELREGQSFAIRVRRAGEHPFTSLDVAKAAAARILEDLAERKPRVDLDEPDWEAHVEVRNDITYVFRERVRGPGGLPLASQGRVGVLVEDARAAHAAWLAGKRGAALYFFTASPQAEAWLAPLAPWVPTIRLRAIVGAQRAERLAAAAPEIEKHRCQALIVSDSLAESLASAEHDKLAGVPVFRPLTGFAGKRFQKLAREAELPEA